MYILSIIYVSVFFNSKFKKTGVFNLSILGMVTEYNPFHNGHKYLLQEAKKVKSFDYSICVMSGHFLQRGEPAVCNKWARAEMALSAGVDLVIELPFVFSCQSANYFARGALKLLNLSGVVTDIAFGSESGEISDLKDISSILLEEPVEFRLLLKRNLSLGQSFPHARSEALKSFCETNYENLYELISKPNNILGIEYLKTIQEDLMNISALTIKRKGANYHDTEISEFASATAIRLALIKNDIEKDVKSTMPSECFDILKREIVNGRAPIAYELLDTMLFYKLRTMSSFTLSKIHEVTEGLENKILKEAFLCNNLLELKDKIKSKRYSMTRINRIMIYALMGLTQEEAGQFNQIGPQYLHILGSTAKGFEVIKKINDEFPELKIIIRGSEMKKAVEIESDPLIKRMLEYDILASDLYSLLYPSVSERKGRLDFLNSAVFI